MNDYIPNAPCPICGHDFCICKKENVMPKINWITKHKKNPDTLAGNRTCTITKETIAFSQDIVDEFEGKVNIGLGKDIKDNNKIFFAKGDMDGFKMSSNAKNRIKIPTSLKRLLTGVDVSKTYMMFKDGSTYYIVLDCMLF